MDFSPLAPYYRVLEAILAAGTLQRMRAFGLDRLPTVPHVLIVGDGHGRGTETILRAVPGATVTVVELSARMIAVARQRLSRRGLDPDRVAWICADIREWRASPAQFDAIVTQFVLDCFSAADVDAVVARLGARARPGAVWLLADFAIPARGWMRWRAIIIHRLMYAFFRRVVGLEARELTPPDRALARCGFVLEARRSASAGLVHADVWVRGRSDRENVPA